MTAASPRPPNRGRSTLRSRGRRPSCFGRRRASFFYGCRSALGWHADFSAGDWQVSIRSRLPARHARHFCMKRHRGAPCSVAWTVPDRLDIEAARADLVFLSAGFAIARCFTGAVDSQCGTDSRICPDPPLSGPQIPRRGPLRLLRVVKDPDGNGWLFQEDHRAIALDLDRAIPLFFTSQGELAGPRFARRRRAWRAREADRRTRATCRTGIDYCWSPGAAGRSCRLMSSRSWCP